MSELFKSVDICTIIKLMKHSKYAVAVNSKLPNIKFSSEQQILRRYLTLIGMSYESKCLSLGPPRGIFYKTQ